MPSTAKSSSANKALTKVHQVMELHVFSVVVLVVVLVGAVKSIVGDLDYEGYVRTVSVLVGATAIGRGLAAYKR